MGIATPQITVEFWISNMFRKSSFAMYVRIGTYPVFLHANQPRKRGSKEIFS